MAAGGGTAGGDGAVPDVARRGQHRARPRGRTRAVVAAQAARVDVGGGRGRCRPGTGCSSGGSRRRWTRSRCWSWCGWCRPSRRGWQSAPVWHVEQALVVSLADQLPWIAAEVATGLMCCCGSSGTCWRWWSWQRSPARARWSATSRMSGCRGTSRTPWSRRWSRSPASRPWAGAWRRRRHGRGAWRCRPRGIRRPDRRSWRPNPMALSTESWQPVSAQPLVLVAPWSTARS